MTHAHAQFLPSTEKPRFRPQGIVFVTDCYYPMVDGVVRVVENLHRYYLARHVVSYVLCSKFPGHHQENLENIIRLPSIQFPRAGKYRTALPWFIKHRLDALDPSRISLVHIHSPFFVSKRVIAWAHQHGKPVILTFHSKYFDKMKNAVPPVLGWMAKLAYKYPIQIANQCDAITTPTESFRKMLIQHGVHPERIFVVPHGVTPLPPITETTLSLKSNAFLKKISAQKETGKKILLYVGQLIREKNPDFLLQAWAKLRDQKFPFYGVIVGSGDRLRALRDLISELHLSHHVLLTQRIIQQEVLHNIYDLADLFTFPSTYETQGMVVLEAAQHGVPTLGIQHATGISDLITHQHSGFLAPFNPQAYAQGIIDAFQDRSRYQRVAQNAQRTIPVSIEDMVAGFEQLYASCIDQKVVAT